MSDSGAPRLIPSGMTLPNQQQDPPRCGIYNPTDPRFGAKGDGVTDDTIPFQRMFHLIAEERSPFSGDSSDTAWSGAKVCIPPGVYYLRTDMLTCRSPITIEGAGEGISILDFHGVGSGLDLRLVILAESLRWRRMARQSMVKGLTFRKQPGAESALDSVGLFMGSVKPESVKPFQISRVEQCAFTDFHTLLKLEFVSVANLRDNYFRSPSLSMPGEAFEPCSLLITGGCADVMISENYFDPKRQSVNASSIIIDGDASGLRIKNNKFTGEDNPASPDGPPPFNHIAFYNPATNPGTYILQIQNNSIEAAAGAQIYFGWDGGNHYLTQIQNNEFSMANGANGIVFNLGTEGKVQGVKINGNIFAETTSPPVGTAVKLTQGSMVMTGVDIQDNTFGVADFPVATGIENVDVAQAEIAAANNMYYAPINAVIGDISSANCAEGSALSAHVLAVNPESAFNIGGDLAMGAGASIGYLTCQYNGTPVKIDIRANA